MAGQDTGRDEVITGSAARQMLRDVTLAAHERLHRHPVLEPLLEPTLTLDAYRAALEGLYGFHAAMERTIAIEPSRADLIRRDLVVLGMPHPEVDGLAEATTVPPAIDEPARLGYRYVVVGSYLGGKLICANLVRTLGIGPQTGAAFFSGEGADVAALWRALMTDLDAALDTPDRRRAAADGALAAFAALADWLDLPPAERRRRPG